MICGYWALGVSATGSVLVRTSWQLASVWASCLQGASFYVEPQLLVVAKEPTSCHHRKGSWDMISAQYYYVVAHRHANNYYYNPEPSGWLPNNIYPEGSSMMTHVASVNGRMKLKDHAGNVLRKSQQNPRELMHLIHHYCKEGGIVYDGSCGTGSIIEACLRLHRTCVVVDSDKMTLELGLANQKKIFKYYLQQGLISKDSNVVPKKPEDIEILNSTKNVKIKKNSDGTSVVILEPSKPEDAEEVEEVLDHDDEGQARKQPRPEEEQAALRAPEVMAMISPTPKKSKPRSSEKKKTTEEKKKTKGKKRKKDLDDSTSEEEEDYDGSESEEDDESKKRLEEELESIEVKRKKKAKKAFTITDEGYIVPQARLDVAIPGAYFPPNISNNLEWLLAQQEPLGIRFVPSNTMHTGTALSASKFFKEGEVLFYLFGRIIAGDEQLQAATGKIIYNLIKSSSEYQVQLWIEGSQYCPATYITPNSYALKDNPRKRPSANCIFVESDELLHIAGWKAVAVKAIMDIDLNEELYYDPMLTDDNEIDFFDNKKGYEFVEKRKAKDLITPGAWSKNYADQVKYAWNVIYTDVGLMLSSDVLLNGLLVKKDYVSEANINMMSKIMFDAIGCGAIQLSPYCNEGQEICKSLRGIFMMPSQNAEYYSELFNIKAMKVRDQEQATRLKSNSVFGIAENERLKVFAEELRTSCQVSSNEDFIAMEGNFQHGPYPNHLEAPGKATKEDQAGDGFGKAIITLVLRQAPAMSSTVILFNKQRTRCFKFDLKAGDMYSLQGNARNIMSHAVICSTYPEQSCTIAKCECKLTAVLRYGLHTEFQRHSVWNYWEDACSKKCEVCSGKKSFY